MNKWVSSVEKSYHHIYHELTTSSPSAVDDKIPTNWTEERFKHIINLREEALDKGRELWAEFVWVIVQLNKCNKIRDKCGVNSFTINAMT
jgi:collagen beta-1,O-galactosyltransferase